MAITINIYYTGTNGSAKAFADDMMKSGIVDRIRSEAGNLKYAYFYPAEDAETVLLIDSWKDQEALDIHHASPMMQEITELRNRYDLHMKVERYVSDESDAAQDQKFIRQ